MPVGLGMVVEKDPKADGTSLRNGPGLQDGSSEALGHDNQGNVWPQGTLGKRPETPGRVKNRRYCQFGHAPPTLSPASRTRLWIP